jgi:hypothetical protein
MGLGSVLFTPLNYRRFPRINIIPRPSFKQKQ